MWLLPKYRNLFFIAETFKFSEFLLFKIGVRGSGAHSAAATENNWCYCKILYHHPGELCTNHYVLQCFVELFLHKITKSFVTTVIRS